MQTNIPYYITDNLQYLRAQLELTIEELALNIDIDPIDLYEVETGRRDIDQVETMDILVDICGYFTVALEDIVLSNLQMNKSCIPSTLIKLRQEIAGVEYKRNGFKKTYFKDDIPLTQVEFEEALKELNDLQANSTKTHKTASAILESNDIPARIEVMASLLRVFHKSHIAQKRYNYLRKKGLIEKNDFWERGVI